MTNNYLDEEVREDQPTENMRPFTINVSERVKRLPPYLFAELNKLKYEKRKTGADVIDLGMGSPSDPPNARSARESGDADAIKKAEALRPGFDLFFQ